MTNMIVVSIGFIMGYLITIWMGFNNWDLSLGILIGGWFVFLMNKFL